MIDSHQEALLTGGGECPLHTHPQEVLDFDDLLDLMAATPVNTVDSDYTPTKGDFIVLVDTSLNDVTITMPLASLGREFHIVKISKANRVFVVPTPPDNLIGSTEGVVIYNRYTSIHMKSIAGGYIFL